MMYGTVARMRLKPGQEAALQQMSREYETMNVPGYVSSTVYRMDADSNEFYMAVVFDDRETYRANAESPEQNARYEKMLEMLDGEPEWHDGEIVYSR
jgi:antibiotic biosynthesis monooxygenase (ABM) superfamily enzyme